jgi:hypothetical protein
LPMAFARGWRRCNGQTGASVRAISRCCKLAVCRSACWRHLYGAFTVWLDVNPEEAEDDAPQRGAYSEAEVQLKLKDVETSGESRETVVDSIVAQVCSETQNLFFVKSM